MAWAGRSSAKHRSAASRASKRRPHPLPRVDDPRGIPSSVLKGLAALRIANADRETYSRKLTELLGAIEKNGD